MAKLEQIYNVDDMPKSERGNGDFTPVPDGWYRVRITSADLKDTKAGGSRIAPRFDIIGPTHAGRVLFGSINIRNASPKAEEIGFQQLGELCRAVGIVRIGDTDELIGKTLDIRVVVKPAVGAWPAGNDVKNFRAVDGSALPASPGASGSTTPASGGKSPPWKK